MVAIALGGLSGGSLWGIIPDAAVGQYHAIPERNVFGLRPPPAQAAPTNPPAPLPKITLTGITTILESKRALMKLAPTTPKPGDPGKEQSLILTEGQREAGVEVLQIDETAGSVKVNNSGTVMVLTFERDGAKLPASPPVAPGTLPAPSALPTTVTPAANPFNPNPRGNLRALPGRTPRSMPPLPGAPGLGAATAAQTGIASAPSVSSVPAPSSPVVDQELTPEEQAIVAELQRQGNATIPTFTPPPVTTPSAATTATPGVNSGVPNQQPLVLVPQ